jgi:flagellar basal-body rod protein FlgC
MSLELIPAGKIISSGLRAEKMRMEVAASNLANSNSTARNAGELYQRQEVIFKSVVNQSFNSKSPTAKLGGVEVLDVIGANRTPLEIYNPSHPHADEKGIVRKPDISPIEEMVDMMTASRAYEANLNVMKQSKEMAKRLIRFAQG